MEESQKKTNNNQLPDHNSDELMQVQAEPMPAAADARSFSTPLQPSLRRSPATARAVTNSGLTLTICWPAQEPGRKLLEL